MLLTSYVRSTALRSALALLAVVPLLSSIVRAADPSPEAARLGRVAAPFVTPNTQSILYADVERTNLKKIGDEVITKSSGPDMIKGMAMAGLGSVIEKHTELKQAGIAEIIIVTGGKVDAEGKPAGQPEVVAIVRKSANAKSEDVIEKVQELVPPEGQPFIAKTWVVADWIAMAPADPQTLSAPKEKRPTKLMSDLFDHLLQTGRGIHVAFVPQPELRKAAKGLLAKSGDSIPPFLPPQAKSLPKLGELLVDGEFTTLSVVADPEPKIVLTASAADADAAKDVNRILASFVEMIPDLPQFQDNADGAKKLVDALTPKMAHNRVTVALQTSDGSLTQIVSMGMEAAVPLMMGGFGPPPGDGAGFPPGFGPPASGSDNLKQIALAMHNHHDVFRSFPPATDLISDSDNPDAAGKPRWSWRVKLLPYIDEYERFDKLDMGSPWDSPKNAALLKETPAIFRHPSFPDDPPGTTRYAFARFKGGAFEKAKGPGMGAIPDGTSNTIMIVVLDKPIPWQKPGDFEVDLKDPTKGLHVEDGEITVALFDGAVETIPATYKKKIALMLTPDEGVPIPDDLEE
jgi:hypothetical protein